MNSVKLNKNLDESTRLEYLSAIGITCWSPKHSLQTVLEASPEEQPIHTSEAKTLVERNSANSDSASALNSADSVENKAINLPPTNEQFVPREASQSPEVQITETQQIEPQAETQSEQAVVEVGNVAENQKVQSTPNQFLKVLNWSNHVLAEENAKSLLIICRHQVDQPANSFARVSTPSQFMMDYINALTAANEGKLEIKVQLAQLSAAGLSEDSVPLSTVLQQNKPHLVLVLGEETVGHLFGDKLSVAELRGQLNQLEQSYDSLVSYHPFSLIQNPALKRLAFEDLSLVSERLNQET